MKLYILTDLEGVAGVARWDQTGRESPGYPQAVRLCTEELRACVAGIQATEPKAEIWVWDAHGCGSIDLERFPRGARLLNNTFIRPPLFLDQGFNGLFFLAQHARAGTLNANLAHTYSSETIASYHINGLELGEFGCRTALAGSFGVPAVFVSGDDKMMAEARALVPQIYCAEVKIGLGPQLALHLAPDDARDLIRDVAAQATSQAHNIAPFQLPGPPYEQRVVLCGRHDPSIYLTRGFRQVGAQELVLRAESLSDLMV
ncbi:MAG: M55 family metallopeptidase [Anaerolineae bacterium]